MTARSSTQRLRSVLVSTYLRIGMADREATRLADATVEILHRHFGGSGLYVPQSRTDDERRNGAIRARRAQGVSIRRLAREFHLSKSRVHQVLEGAGEVSSVLG